MESRRKAGRAAVRLHEPSRRAVIVGGSAAYPTVATPAPQEATEPAINICRRWLIARPRAPWPLVVSQWWRWRHPRLWRGRTFDPHNSQQVMSYAVLRLRPETRDVFLLNHIKALDYTLIARHFGLSTADIQAHLADALFEISRAVELIERVRPLPKPFEAEQPDV